MNATIAQRVTQCAIRSFITSRRFNSFNDAYYNKMWPNFFKQHKEKRYYSEFASKNPNLNIKVIKNIESRFSTQRNPDDYYVSTLNDITRSIPRQTIYEFFMKLLKKHSDQKIMYYKSDPSLNFYDQHLTMQQSYDVIMNAAKSLIKLGVEPQNTVCMMGFNSPKWLITEISTCFIGSLHCGLYNTNSPETCEYIMERSKCQMLVVENRDYLESLRTVLFSNQKVAGELKGVVICNDDKVIQDPLPYDDVEVDPIELIGGKIPVYTWCDFIRLSHDIKDESVVDRARKMNPNDCCMLIYTSGTTGTPKGVMISHDNLLYNAECITMKLRSLLSEKRIISYLPLSHIAANQLDIIFALNTISSIYFTNPDALSGNLRNYMQQSLPTVFCGVPRVYEKIRDKMTQDLEAKTSGLLSRTVLNWIMNVGKRNTALQMEGRAPDWQYYICRHLLFDRIKKALGLDKSQFIGSIGAPLSPDTFDFFTQFDICLMQAYGLSESSGAITLSLPGEARAKSQGNPLPGTEIKLIDVNEHGVGELCARGRNIFIGYKDDKERTKEALTEDGWLRTGDLGYFEHDENTGECFLFIIGRKDETIVTSAGKNLSPVAIEDRIKTQLPFIGHVMVIGNERNYLTCLMTMKVEINSEDMTPTNILAVDAQKYFSKIVGKQLTTTDQVLNIVKKGDDVISHKINQEISKVNLLALSRPEHVRKWTLLEKEFSVVTGELGPTMKMKRKQIIKLNQSLIDEMYRK